MVRQPVDTLRQPVDTKALYSGHPSIRERRRRPGGEKGWPPPSKPNFSFLRATQRTCLLPREEPSARRRQRGTLKSLARPRWRCEAFPCAGWRRAWHSWCVCVAGNEKFRPSVRKDWSSRTAAPFQRATATGHSPSHRRPLAGASWPLCTAPVATERRNMQLERHEGAEQAGLGGKTRCKGDPVQGCKEEDVSEDKGIERPANELDAPGFRHR